MKFKGASAKVSVLKVTISDTGKSANIRCKTTRRDGEGKFHNSYFNFLAIGKLALGKSLTLAEKLKTLETWENGDVKNPVTIYISDIEITSELYDNKGRAEYPIRFKLFDFAFDEVIPELTDMLEQPQPTDEDEFPF